MILQESWWEAPDMSGEEDSKLKLARSNPEISTTPIIDWSITSDEEPDEESEKSQSVRNRSRSYQRTSLNDDRHRHGRSRSGERKEAKQSRTLELSEPELVERGRKCSSNDGDSEEDFASQSTSHGGKDSYHSTESRGRSYRRARGESMVPDDRTRSREHGRLTPISVHTSRSRSRSRTPQPTEKCSPPIERMPSKCVENQRQINNAEDEWRFFHHTSCESVEPMASKASRARNSSSSSIESLHSASKSSSRESPLDNAAQASSRRSESFQSERKPHGKEGSSSDSDIEIESDRESDIEIESDRESDIEVEETITIKRDGSSANSDLEVEEIFESEREPPIAEESDADSDLEIEEIRTIPKEGSSANSDVEVEEISEIEREPPIAEESD